MQQRWVKNAIALNICALRDAGGIWPFPCCMLTQWCFWLRLKFYVYVFFQQETQWWKLCKVWMFLILGLKWFVFDAVIYTSYVAGLMSHRRYWLLWWFVSDKIFILAVSSSTSNRDIRVKLSSYFFVGHIIFRWAYIGKLKEYFRFSTD